MKTKKILLRILCFPLVACILLINSLLFWALEMYRFLKNGGEQIIYKDEDRASILEIYQILKETGTK